MKFSRRIPGPSHEVSSQSVITRDWFGNFLAINGPSWPHNGHLYKYFGFTYLHEKSCLVGVICDHVIINFDFVAFTVLLEQKSDAVSTDFVLGLYGTNKALSSWGFDMKGWNNTIENFR